MMTTTERKMLLENKHLFVWFIEGKSLEKCTHKRLLLYSISKQTYEFPIMLP